ncbi:MAG: type VI secretion system tube protein Hcp [Acidobacteria bacterium]|nr:type VI secretion system tube protein Hcp [Acidobacteriota bacterium]
MSTAHFIVDGVEGESQHEGYVNHMDIMNYSKSVSNPPSLTGGGFSAGKPNASDFNFMIAKGKSSTNLEKLCLNGTHIPTATLKLTKTVGDATLKDYMIYTFTDCFISSVSDSGQDGATDEYNSVSLAYSKMKIEYKEQKTAGGGLENAASLEYDFKAIKQS